MTKKQIEQFLTRGFTIIEGCFTPEQAAPFVEAACERAGVDAGAPSTWKEKRVHAPKSLNFALADFAPKAWEAAVELVGGTSRIHEPENPRWQDAFIIKFPHGRGRHWPEPSPSSAHSWHLDGGPDMKHYLDSGDIGLVTLLLWSKVGPKGGGTIFACDSVPRVAKYLLDHPEGVQMRERDINPRLMTGCKDFFEFTGDVGDVLLAHPLAYHSESDNVDGPPRFQSVGHVLLNAPLKFDRKPDSEHSAVERAILRGLGRKSLAFARR